MYKNSKTRKKQKIKQKGGEKIGQGSFGCVIKPAAQCGNKPTSKNYISKITYITPGNEDDYNIELQILKKIHNIDPLQKYFISIVDECQLNMKQVVRNPKDTVNVSYYDDNLTDFTIDNTEPNYIHNMNTKELTKKYCLIDRRYFPRNQIQINGGPNLAEILPTSHLELYNLIRKNYKSIILHLLNGLNILHKHRIAHRDIKEFNILCMPVSKSENAHSSTKNIHVRYIDFGLSEIVNPNTDEGGLHNFHYSGSPGYIPLEFVLLHYMNKYINNYGISSIHYKSNKKYIIDKVITNYTNNYKKFYNEIRLEKSLLHMPHVDADKSHTTRHTIFLDKNYLSDLLDYFINVIYNKTFYKILKSDVNGLLYKGDVYGLGITIAYLRKHYKLGHDKQLTDLIKNMVKLKHTERYNLQQCLSHPFCVATN